VERGRREPVDVCSATGHSRLPPLHLVRVPARGACVIKSLARHDETKMGQQEIKLGDLLAGKVGRISLSPGINTFVLRRKRAELIEFSDALFRYNSGVLLPNATLADKKGELHGGLELIAACLAYVQAHPAKKVLVTGHTDTVGSNDSNVKLSEIRSQAVHGMLVGDRSEFAAACFGPHLTDDKRYPHSGDGSKAGVLWSDYSDVLNWLATQCGFPCQCGFPKGSPWIYDATLRFQKAYNASPYRAAAQPEIKATGKFDEPTWAAVFDCYDATLPAYLKLTQADVTGIRGKLQFVAPDQPYVCCGELKPIDQIGRDNYNSQTNRRVEVLFFDPGEDPNALCLQGGCDPATCDVFDTTAFKRHHLPPALSIQAWLAEWDRPTEAARLGDKRKMILSAPDLPDGESVTFEVYANGRGPIGRPVTAKAVGGQATGEWCTWFDASEVTSPFTLAAGEPFPAVNFDFVAKAGGTETRSMPLPYSDAIRVQLHWSLEGANGPELEPMVDTAYTLHSPFGTRTGKTQIEAGSDGWAIEKDLPPGGVTIVLPNGYIAVAT
jgi:hypothetical protein